MLVDLSGILIGLRDRQLNKQIQKQTINKNLYDYTPTCARAHHEQQESGHQAQAGLSGSTAFAYSERKIAQCKADIDIHHREHGGTWWNKVEQGTR